MYLVCGVTFCILRVLLVHYNKRNCVIVKIGFGVFTSIFHLHLAETLKNMHRS